MSDSTVTEQFKIISGVVESYHHTWETSFFDSRERDKPFQRPVTSCALKTVDGRKIFVQLAGEWNKGDPVTGVFMGMTTPNDRPALYPVWRADDATVDLDAQVKEAQAEVEFYKQGSSRFVP